MDNIKSKDIKTSMKNYFPFPEFRKYQEKVLDAIESAFQQKKIVILEAPTGAGKSSLAIAVAKYFGDAYINTSQKILQDQYVKDFNLVQMKGKSNYQCKVKPVPANLMKCKGCNTFCDYKIALKKALEVNITILNYHVALMQPKFRENLRELLICDECHNIEQIFMGMVEFSIKPKTLARMGVTIEKPATDDIEKLKEWIQDDLLSEIDDLLDQLEFAPQTQDNIKLEDKLNNLKTRIELFLESFDDTPWTYCENDNIFKPIYVKYFTRKLFNLSNDKILLMSATVLDIDSFCESIGLEPQNVAYIQVPSTFPTENRQINLEHCNVSLKYTNIETGLRDLTKQVKLILAKHPNEKGMIHTTNYKIAEHIYNSIEDDRLFYVAPGDREAALLKHVQSNYPSVLISPSMTEGVDLKDDLARFQIICKIPYPFLGDKQISERKKIDPSWYAWRTCLAIVQSYGRAIRSETDYAITYVIDNSFRWFIKQNIKRLPDWFLKAIKY